MTVMRAALLALTLAATASPAAAQVLPGTDVGAALRLENAQRWNESQLRNLEADIGRLRTDQTVRRLQTDRQPDPLMAGRQAQTDAVQADNLARAAQAASTARAAGLRASDPAYDRRLRDLGYATGLPLSPR